MMGTHSQTFKALTRLVLIRPPLSTRSFSVSSNSQKTWGFIGLGQMGYPMAKNLRAKIPHSDTLVIYDVNGSATQRFAEEVGVTESKTIEIAKGVREVAEKAETIITMLPQPKHVKGVYADILSGKLPTLSQSRLFIDSSTIDVQTSLQVGESVRSSDAGEFVDAPVSGGVVGAEAGTLTFMLGAPSSTLERVEPVLSMMGRRILHCGDPGMGLAGKLTNNYLLAINNVGTAEAMNLGIKLGLDAKVLANLINVSTGKCWPSEVNNPVPGVVENAPAGRGYSGGFGVSLMAKDLKLAIAAADLAKAKLVLAESARKLYDEAEVDDNCKGKDFSVVYKYLQN